MIDHQTASVQDAPEYKRPTCPVPETPNEHRYQEVPVFVPAILAQAANRKIDVVSEPIGERNVPTLQKIYYRGLRDTLAIKGNVKC